MARTWICGWETGAVDGDKVGSASVTAVIESTIVRTGAYSLKAAPASGAVALWSAGVTKTGYVRFYLRVTARPATTARLIFGTTAPSTINLRLNPDGTIGYYVTNTLIGTSTTALSSTTTWYRIEARQADGTSVTVLQIDGTSEVTGSPASWLFAMTFGCADTVADTYTAYFDDATTDSAGFPGVGAAALLLASSISSAGGWVEGDGAGTAGIVGAVSTRPPPGLASANETSATNMESPTNSATDNIDLTLQTYTAGGVSGTVNGVSALVRHGEDISTGTKAGAVLIVSNPTQGSEDAFEFGDDQGAHGADLNVWRTTHGTVQDSPSVTLGTAPVLRVGKRTATTRVICVDFLGLYVDYTPSAGAAVQVPYRSPYPQLLAH